MPKELIAWSSLNPSTEWIDPETGEQYKNRPIQEKDNILIGTFDKETWNRARQYANAMDLKISTLVWYALKEYLDRRPAVDIEWMRSHIDVSLGLPEGPER